MIKTITFDFGGVLYKYDGDNLLRALSGGSDIGIEDFRNLMSGSTLDRAHFRGELNARELLEITRRGGPVSYRGRACRNLRR